MYWVKLGKVLALPKALENNLMKIKSTSKSGNELHPTSEYLKTSAVFDEFNIFWLWMFIKEEEGN